MSKRIIFIFGLCLLLFIIVSPVSAYTELYTQSASGTTNAGFTGWQVKDFAAFRANVTRVVWTGTCADFGTNAESGSFTTDIHSTTSGGTAYGWVTVTWSGLTNQPTWGTCTVTMDVINTTAQTGTKDLLWHAGAGLLDSAYTKYGTNVVDNNVNAVGFLAGGATRYLGSGTTISYGGSSVVAPVSSFSCVPTSQYPNTDVACVDSSSNTPTSWLWTIDYPALGIIGWQTSTNKNFSWQSAYPGVFTVNLKSTNTAGSDWENKTNYVEISTNAVPNGTGLQDETNMLLTVKNGLNSTVLQNAYVELSYNNGDNTNAGYTDFNGQISFGGMEVIEYTASIFKTGYQPSVYVFTPTPDSYARTFYMYPNIGTPAIPDNIDVTIRVMDKQTYLPLSNSLVTIKNIMTNGGTLQTSTNATGHVTFYDYPNSAYIGGTIQKTGYVYQNWALPYNLETSSFWQSGDIVYTVDLTPTSSVTPTGTIVVPTPTPISVDKLILTATPDSINLGSSVSLVGSSSNATRLTYAGGLRRTSFYVNTHAQTYPVDFNMIGVFENVNATYWKFRANNSATWNTPTTASPLTLANTPNVNGLLTYAFNAYDTNGAIATAGIDEVLVGGGAGGGALTIKLGAYDATTTGRIQNFQLNITDEGSGVVTEFGTVAYDTEITLPRGNGYVARASKTGYQTSSTIGETGTLLFIVPTSLNIQKGDFGAGFNVPLFPDGSVIAGNTSISSRVFDIETYYPISGVQVINSNAPTDIKYTGTDAESVAWVIPHNTAFTLTASKSGYCTITESKNTGTLSSMWIPLYLKYGSCTGATATPTPTPTITPTATPIGGWGNVTGGATVCGVMPDDATIIDILKNSMACNGLKDTQSQNLGMSMLIILFAAIILGRIAKGVGVLAGAIIGTVISTVAGFLPFWIIIVVIIMAGLVFAGKVFWSNSQ